jgi:hypothetical protein
MTKVEKLAIAVHKNGERMETTTHAVGGGEWSIEVKTVESGFLFELVGSNGTQDWSKDENGYPQSDDLWADLSAIEAEAEALAFEKGWFVPYVPETRGKRR